MSGVTSLLHGRLSYFAYSPQSPENASGSRIARSFRPSLALLGATLLTGLVISFGAATALAQLPVPQLNSVFPPGLKQGATAEVTLAGTDLDEADKLLFSHPGITAAPKMSEPNDFVKTPRPLGTSFTVKVEGNVPPGGYEVRAVNRFGVSNPRVFQISDQEEVVKVAGNSSLEKAQELAVGAIVSGRADANARDFYKVNLAAGQRVLVETWAERIDSKMDTTLAIFGADGRELARSRDVDSRDAILDFTPPAAGQYVVTVFDFLYGGGPDYFYRLSVHTKPRIEFVFPPAGPAGSNNSYTIYGRNLPGGQPAAGVMLNGVALQKVTANIAIPADSAARPPIEAVPTPRASLVDRVDFRLPGSNAVPVSVSQSAPILEVEPNDTPATAQKITVPCEVAGQFYPRRDADWLQFDAKKGDVFMMEVVSHRLGLESDPLLVVKKVGKNDKGEETMADVANVDDPQDRNTRIGGDFDTSTDDPSYKFTATEDATYRVMVRDQFGDSRLDPRNVYRLIIRKDEPTFQALVVAMVPAAAGQNNQPGPIVLGGPVLRRGGSTMLQLTVDRRDDFKGEVSVSIEGLPAGVTCPGAILGGDVNSAALILSAEENAAAWTGPIRVVAKAQVNGKEVVRVARTGTVAWGSANRQQATPTFRTTRDLVLAVTDKEMAPAFVKAGDDKVWETSLGGKLEVPLNLTRRGDYKEAVKLAAIGLPAEIKPAEVNLDANTAAGKLEIPVTNQATKPGVYTFYLRSDTKMKYARNPDAVKAAEEDQAFVVARIAER
ncbi:MAG: PPC domain-containing protein, partial [Planctomycetota bacterium]